METSKCQENDLDFVEISKQLISLLKAYILNVKNNQSSCLCIVCMLSYSKYLIDAKHASLNKSRNSALQYNCGKYAYLKI